MKRAEMTDTDVVVVLCTASPGEADSLARSLVKSGLCACVNVSGVRSHYLWEGTLCDDEEALLMIKTRRDRVGPLADKIMELHSYEVPEILVLPVIFGEEAYVRWVGQVLG